MNRAGRLAVVVAALVTPIACDDQVEGSGAAPVADAGGAAPVADAGGAAPPGPRDPHFVLQDGVLQLESYPEFLSVEVRDGSLEFQFSGEPKVIPSAGEIVVGSKSGGYLRKVTSVVLSKVAVEQRDSTRRLRIATEDAALTEVFRSASFALVPEGATSPGAGPSRRISTGEVEVAMQPLMASAKLTNTDGIAVDGLDATVKVGTSLDGQVNLPTVAFYIDEDEGPRFEIHYDPKPLFEAVLTADVTLSMTSYSSAVLRKKGAVFKSPHIRYIVPAGAAPIPVVIGLVAEVDLGVDLTLSGKGSVSFASKLTAGVRPNIRTDVQRGEVVWAYPYPFALFGDFEILGTPSAQTELGLSTSAQVTASGKVFLEPRLRFDLYGVEIATLGLEFYERVSIIAAGGLDAQTGTCVLGVTAESRWGINGKFDVPLSKLLFGPAPLEGKVALSKVLFEQPLGARPWPFRTECN